MGRVKDWLNERPGAAAIEADEQHAAAPAASTPFNPRTEVSADAKYIVRNFVLWFLVLPALLSLLIWGVANSLK